MEYQTSKQKWLERIFIVVATAVITFMCTIVVINRSNQEDSNDKSSIKNIILNQDSNKSTNKYALLDEIKDYLEDNYLGTLDEDKMLEYAASGYVYGVGDEYTEFVGKENANRYMEALTGSFAGIGVYLIENPDKDEIVVAAPIDGSPAQKAGIKANDVIIKVDNFTYTGKTIDEAADKMRGEERNTC